jgi:hypothetical protein
VRGFRNFCAFTNESAREYLHPIERHYTRCSRRTLGVFQLVERVSELGSNHELPETAVAVDAENSLIVQAHYVSANDSFSVIARHRTPAGDFYVLAACGECHCIPVGLVCRLLTGQYLEIWLQHERSTA